MNQGNKAAQGSAATAKPTFKQMTSRQKFVFVLKVIVSVASFGMIFPNLME